MSRSEWLVSALIIAILMLIIFGAWMIGDANHTTPTSDFRMETVKTGDVTWACLKQDGEYLGCDTVEQTR